MSAAALSGIIFVLTLGGILLGALLRRTLPKHHLSEEAQDVVRLGVGLIATIAALVLGLLIAVRLIGSVRNFPDTGVEQAVHRLADDIECATAKRSGTAVTGRSPRKIRQSAASPVAGRHRRPNW
jgi:hypothetical protein